MADTQTLLKVTQEKLPDSQIGLEIEVPPELSQKIYNQVVENFVRNADIPCFRKGKVPRPVVLQRLGQARLRAAAVEELVQKSLEQAISQAKISALGNYQLRSDFDQLVSQYQPGAALTFSASVDVPPEVTLSTYTGLQVRAQQIEYDPTKVENILTEQRNQRATLIPVEGRPAQAGDVVQIDFAGRLAEPDPETGETEEIEGGQASDFQLELVPGQFIPGFIEGVIGMELGETKEVSTTFPEGYFQESLSGKPAVFTITLNDIKEKELPALDDEFAAEVSEFDTLAKLEEFLEQRYRQEADQQTETNTNAAILNALVKNLEAELPETLLRQEVNFLLTQFVTRLQGQGLDVNRLLNDEMVDRLREQMRPEAIVRLKRSLALAEVAKLEKITISPSELEDKFQATLQQLGERQVDRQRLRGLVEDELLEAKVLKWLREQSQVELTTEPIPDESEPETLPETSPEAATTTLDAEAVTVEPEVATETVVTETTETEKKKTTRRSPAKSTAKAETEATAPEVEQAEVQAEATESDVSDPPPKKTTTRKPKKTDP